MSPNPRRSLATVIILVLILINCIAIPFIDVLYFSILKENASSSVYKWLFTIQPFLYAFFLMGSLCLITIVLVINRDCLNEFNIDRSFLGFIFFAGASVFILGTIFNYYTILGCLSGLATISVAFMWKRRKFRFAETTAQIWKLSLIFLGVFVISLLAVHDFNAVGTVAKREFVFVHVPISIIEEIVFRGMVWKVLRDLKRKEPEIILYQTILFWLAHMSAYLSDPLDFWVIVPLSGLLLGSVVWRSKSITTSTVFHILINLFILVAYPK